MAGEAFGSERVGEVQKRVIAWVRRVAASEGMSAGKFTYAFDPETRRMALAFGLSERRKRMNRPAAASIEGVAMPARIARLPRDQRGFPVPRFVEWLKKGTNGEVQPARRGDYGAEPDFRYADFDFRELAWLAGLCWVCGEAMGRHRVFVIGPMCVVNRTTMEPPCHRDCAEYAAKACPFLSKPRMRRNDVDLAPGADAPGLMLKRNPGCVCLYETAEAKPFRDGSGGWLIRLGPPSRLDWIAEGRKATRAEVLASIDSGYPLLLAEAEKDGPEAVAELAKARDVALTLVPGK